MVSVPEFLCFFANFVSGSIQSAHIIFLFQTLCLILVMLLLMGPVVIVSSVFLFYTFVFTEHKWIAMLYFTFYIYGIDSARQGGWNFV
jgi:hypothetical protein